MSDPKGLLLVSGASRGIGRYLAESACRLGYEVIGLARHSVADCPYPLWECDVANDQSVSECFAKLRKAPLWGLVNAAGAAAMNLLLTTPPATMRKVLECNLLGTMYCCAQAARLLVRRRAGRIINFSSIAVALGLEGEAAYVAAKAGIEGFTRVFARELAPYGITVNAVAPGPVPTRLIAGVPEDKIAALRQRQILPRALTYEDIWQVVKWLLEPECSMISGEILHVGGV